MERSSPTLIVMPHERAYEANLRLRSRRIPCPQGILQRPFFAKRHAIGTSNEVLCIRHSGLRQIPYAEQQGI
jgi:hypothetical protein